MGNGRSHFFFSSVVKEVKKLPTSLIVGKYVKVKSNPRSDSDGLCPFHGDTHFGNFKINNKKGIYKCFTCGVYGDSIQFVKDLFQLPFKKAVIKIAYDQKLISKEQAEGYLEGKVEEISIQKVSDDLIIKEKPNGVTEIGSVMVRNLAYQVFLKHVHLSEEHRDYLKGRGLTDQEIEAGGFFTFPEPTEEFIGDLMGFCEKGGLTPNVFKQIPGFHTTPAMKLDKVQPKTGEAEYHYTFAKQQGIGIPTKDAFGKIVGIQIRKDNPSEKKKRYTWFSSSYAEYDDNDYIFGTPAGAPTHVATPKENNYPGVVFVTEGYFKAETLASTFGAYAISVSGVGNYRDIVEDLKAIEKKTGEKIEYIYVSYDADMSSNIQVYNHAKNMVALIEEQFDTVEFFISLWNESDGKGIDDLIHNGKKHTLKKVEFKVFERYYDKMLAKFEEKYEMLQRVPKEVVLETYQKEVFSMVMAA